MHLRTLARISCACLLVAAPAIAQIYKTTDADGNVIFTDQPPAGSSGTESVDLQPLNTAPPPPTVSRPAPQPAEPKPVPLEVGILSPENESTIPMGGGIFDVVASPSPELRPGENLQLLMDGAAKGAPQQSSIWKLENVFRGPHDLVVQRLSSDGKVIATSDTVRVYVLRPGL